MKIVALTTKDNPFDPFDEFDEWLAFDHRNGYNTCEYLARIARTSDELTDEENNKEIEAAIDEIISLNVPKDIENEEEIVIHYVKVEREA